MSDRIDGRFPFSQATKNYVRTPSTYAANFWSWRIIIWGSVNREKAILLLFHMLEGIWIWGWFLVIFWKGWLLVWIAWIPANPVGLGTHIQINWKLIWNLLKFSTNSNLSSYIWEKIENKILGQKENVWVWVGWACTQIRAYISMLKPLYLKIRSCQRLSLRLLQRSLIYFHKIA